MQKKEVGLLLYSIEKLVDHTPKFKNYNYKLLEENTGVNLCNLRLSDSFFFLNTILKVQMKKKRSVGLHQIINICAANVTIKKMKIQCTEWEKIYHTASHISDKDLYPEHFFKNFSVNSKK